MKSLYNRFACFCARFSPLFAALTMCAALLVMGGCSADRNLAKAQEVHAKLEQRSAQLGTAVEAAQVVVNMTGSEEAKAALAQVKAVKVAVDALLVEAKATLAEAQKVKDEGGSGWDVGLALIGGIAGGATRGKPLVSAVIALVGIVSKLFKRKKTE